MGAAKFAEDLLPRKKKLGQDLADRLLPQVKASFFVQSDPQNPYNQVTPQRENRGTSWLAPYPNPFESNQKILLKPQFFPNLRLAEVIGQR